MKDQVGFFYDPCINKTFQENINSIDGVLYKGKKKKFTIMFEVPDKIKNFYFVFKYKNKKIFINISIWNGLKEIN